MRLAGLKDSRIKVNFKKKTEPEKITYMRQKKRQKEDVTSKGRLSFDDLTVEEENYTEHADDTIDRVHWMPQALWEEEHQIANPEKSAEDVTLAWLVLLTKTPAAKKQKKNHMWHVAKYFGFFEDKRHTEGNRTSIKRRKVCEDAETATAVLEESRKRALTVLLQNSKMQICKMIGRIVW